MTTNYIVHNKIKILKTQKDKKKTVRLLDFILSNVAINCFVFVIKINSLYI